MIPKILKKWLVELKKYSFSYKDGFYQFPYIANSPELIVKSLESMPFIKNYPQKNYYTINNPFLSGHCYYEKLEDGLWVILSNTIVKKNLTFKLYYDPTVDTNYHSLTMHKVKSCTKLPKIGYEIENTDRSWMLFKAGAKASNFHFKGEESIFLNFYFSEDWRKRNMITNGFLSQKILTSFFESDSEYLYLPNLLEDKQSTYESLISSILNNEKKSALDLRIKALKVIDSFVEKLNTNEVLTRSGLPEKDIRKLYKAQHFLLENITQKFPSITLVSKKVGMSETKLKKDFKKLFGLTLLQYYQKKQIDRAEETLKTNNISVKEVAYAYGYSSISSFSSTFKKIKGHPPSKILAKV